MSGTAADKLDNQASLISGLFHKIDFIPGNNVVVLTNDNSDTAKCAVGACNRVIAIQ